MHVHVAAQGGCPGPPMGCSASKQQEDVGIEVIVDTEDVRQPAAEAVRQGAADQAAHKSAAGPGTAAAINPIPADQSASPPKSAVSSDEIAAVRAKLAAMKEPERVNQPFKAGDKSTYGKIGRGSVNAAEKDEVNQRLTEKKVALDKKKEALLPSVIRSLSRREGSRRQGSRRKLTRGKSSAGSVFSDIGASSKKLARSVTTRRRRRAQQGGASATGADTPVNGRKSAMERGIQAAKDKAARRSQMDQKDANQKGVEPTNERMSAMERGTEAAKKKVAKEAADDTKKPALQGRTSKGWLTGVSWSSKSSKSLVG